MQHEQLNLEMDSSTLPSSQDGAEDDDAWMTGGAADLEAELAKRQKELGDNVAKHAKRTAQGLGSQEAAPDFDPRQMVTQMKV